LIYFILWYLSASVLGWLAFPLAYNLLPALTDRGYAVSKALGLLIWGYIFWLMASFKLLGNDIAGLLIALFLLALASLWMIRRLDREQLKAWWRVRRGFVITVEVFFLLCFAAWAVVRAANPEAVGTEKPMELAFIDAILASPTFPPHDPWLSGYSISYYYFGYVLIAMLAKVSGTTGSIAFNLGISLVFALSAIGAYGLIYNLLAKRKSEDTNAEQEKPKIFLFTSFLGPLFVLIVSNLEGFLQVLHNRGLFWQRNVNGQLTSTFWRWLDIQDLTQPPVEPFTWIPNRFWWWWRASRVLQDYDLAGHSKEIIDEFPFFSYLLADLHPHVLAMPFAFLGITLALNALLGGSSGLISWIRRKIGSRSLMWLALGLIPLGIVFISHGAISLKLSTATFGLVLLILAGFLMVLLWPILKTHGFSILTKAGLKSFEVGSELHISSTQFFFASLVLGGMAFLNTWDFPLYVSLFSAAHCLGIVLTQKQTIRQVIKEFVWLSVALGMVGGILYLPFYLGFSSQAGGVLPNLIYPTRGAHLWVMFAPLLLPIFIFLFFLLSNDDKPASHLTKGLLWTSSLFLLMWILSLLLGFISRIVLFFIPGLSMDLYGAQLSPSGLELFLAAIQRRFASPGGWITLLVLFALTLATFRKLDRKEEESTFGSKFILNLRSNPTLVFTLLLILFGAILVLGPEFFFLQDQFGWRMNTIFKFYFQAWLIWGIAAAYASAFWLSHLHGSGGIAARTGLVAVVAMGLVYPSLSLLEKTNHFQPQEWTLDSAAYMEVQSPDEMAAIKWLKTAAPGVIAEAVPASGGSYTGYARFSTLSGMPAVLGWYGHESQWRGGGDLLGPRLNDLFRLYCSRDWSETKGILDRYQIRYVVVGNLEREAYRAKENNCDTGLNETKFIRYLKTAFKPGNVTIYEYLQPFEN
jgi:uncharacterized membrane protein